MRRLILIQSRNLVRHTRCLNNLFHILITIPMLLPEVKVLPVNLHRQPVIAPLLYRLAVRIRHPPALNEHLDGGRNARDGREVVVREGRPLILVEEVGLDGSGTGRVDADPVVVVVGEGDGAHEVDDSGFGGCVDGTVFRSVLLSLSKYVNEVEKMR